MQTTKKKPSLIFILVGAVLAGYLGYLINGAWTEGIAFNEFMDRFNEVCAVPFANYYNSNTVKAVAIALGIYAMAIVMYYTSQRNYMPGKEFGTARFENPKQVNKILADKDAAVIEEYKELVPMFEKMAELAAILRKKRMKRGSIDFDFPETKVVLDEDGHPIDIKPYDRNVATKLIEDFMLIANETVAEDYFWQEIPFVYRTHDKPDSEKIAKLSTFINNFGYTLHIGADEVHPKELQKLLMKVDGTDEESLISRLTLRSMKQARYTTACTGHFGLAANYYCHFTSPIRRYPDLQIHRIIKENIRGRMNDNRREHYESILDAVAKQASETERRAEEAERETVKLKKCEYMSNHIGECFEGVISGVTEWGFFVELPNTVEGLVRVTDLTDDFYEFYEDTYELAGSATNKRYKLGQKIKVVVDSTDKIMRTIDFKPAE